MSYDLIIAPKAADETWEVALDRLSVGTGLDRALGDESRRMWTALAQRLQAADQDIDQFESQSEVELTWERYGIQLTLFDQQAGLSVPFWRTSDDGRLLLGVVGGIVDAVREASGWSVFDPQLDREIESGTDLDAEAPVAITATFGGHRTPRRRWWRFWR